MGENKLSLESATEYVDSGNSNNSNPYNWEFGGFYLKSCCFNITLSYRTLNNLWSKYLSVFWFGLNKIILF